LRRRTSSSPKATALEGTVVDLRIDQPMGVPTDRRSTPATLSPAHCRRHVFRMPQDGILHYNCGPNNPIGMIFKATLTMQMLINQY
jgi:hypothetical protein